MKNRKASKLLSLVLAVVMVVGMLPLSAISVSAADSRTPIEKVEITTSVGTINPVEGEMFDTGIYINCTQNTTLGAPAYLSTNMFAVQVGDGVDFQNLTNAGEYRKGEFLYDVYYRFSVQLRIDGSAGKDYVLSPNVTLTVDGVPWTVDYSTLYVEDNYSCVLAYSPPMIAAKGRTEINEVKINTSRGRLTAPAEGEVLNHSIYDECEQKTVNGSPAYFNGRNWEKEMPDGTWKHTGNTPTIYGGAYRYVARIEITEGSDKFVLGTVNDVIIDEQHWTADPSTLWRSGDSWIDIYSPVMIVTERRTPINEIEFTTYNGAGRNIVLEAGEVPNRWVVSPGEISSSNSPANIPMHSAFWRKKMPNGTWKFVRDDEIAIYDRPYRLVAQLRIDDSDGANYVLGSDITLTIDGVKWTVDYSTLTIEKDYSCVHVYSPEMTVIDNRTSYEKNNSSAIPGTTGKGDSESSPVVCDTFMEFKLAMEHEDISYIQLNPTVEYVQGKEDQPAIVIPGNPDKTLILNGDSEFMSPPDPEYSYRNLLYSDAMCDLVIKGNGKLAFSSADVYIKNSVLCNEGGNITIEDGVTIEGKVSSSYAKCNAVFQDGGTLTINGGGFVGTSSNARLLIETVYLISGDIIINGGEFVPNGPPENNENAYGLYYDRRGGSLVINGGTFHGIYTPIASLVSYIAEGKGLKTVGPSPRALDLEEKRTYETVTVYNITVPGKVLLYGYEDKLPDDTKVIKVSYERPSADIGYTYSPSNDVKWYVKNNSGGWTRAGTARHTRFHAGEYYKLQCAFKATKPTKFSLPLTTDDVALDGVDPSLYTVNILSQSETTVWVDFIFNDPVPIKLSEIDFTYSGYEYGSRVLNTTVTPPAGLEIDNVSWEKWNGSEYVPVISNSETFMYGTDYNMKVKFRCDDPYVLDNITAPKVKLGNIAAHSYEEKFLPGSVYWYSEAAFELPQLRDPALGYTVRIINGTTDNGSVANYMPGETVNIRSTSNESYAFDSWSFTYNGIAPTLNRTYYGDENSFIMPEKDIELTARFKKNVKPYDVHLDGTQLVCRVPDMWASEIPQVKLRSLIAIDGEIVDTVSISEEAQYLTNAGGNSRSMDFSRYIAEYGNGEYGGILSAADAAGELIDNYSFGQLTAGVVDLPITPINLRWDGLTAKWDCEGIVDKYYVELYKGEVKKNTFEVTTTEYDFSANITAYGTGDYTFVVMPDLNGYVGEGYKAESAVLEYPAGALLKPTGAHWSGTVAKWTAEYIANDYRVNLYKDNVLVEQTNTNSGVFELDLTSCLEARGEGVYRFTVTPIVDYIAKEGATSASSWSITYPIPVGFAVSGTFKSFKDTSNTTIQLIADGTSEAAYETVVQGELSGNVCTGSWSIPIVAPGDYTVKVVKANHVTREYSITVSSSPVTQNVQICLLGDANGDGTVDGKDYRQMYNHINGKNIITDSYTLKSLELTNDTTVDGKDYRVLYNHINGKKSLFS